MIEKLVHKASGELESEDPFYLGRKVTRSGSEYVYTITERSMARQQERAKGDPQFALGGSRQYVQRDADGIVLWLSKSALKFVD